MAAPLDVLLAGAQNGMAKAGSRPATAGHGAQPDAVTGAVAGTVSVGVDSRLQGLPEASLRTLWANVLAGLPAVQAEEMPPGSVEGLGLGWAPTSQDRARLERVGANAADAKAGAGRRDSLQAVSADRRIETGSAQASRQGNNATLGGAGATSGIAESSTGNTGTTEVQASGKFLSYRAAGDLSKKNGATGHSTRPYESSVRSSKTNEIASKLIQHRVTPEQVSAATFPSPITGLTISAAAVAPGAAPTNSGSDFKLASVRGAASAGTASARVGDEQASLSLLDPPRTTAWNTQQVPTSPKLPETQASSLMEKSGRLSSTKAPASALDGSSRQSIFPASPGFALSGLASLDSAFSGREMGIELVSSSRLSAVQADLPDAEGRVAEAATSGSSGAREFGVTALTGGIAKAGRETFPTNAGRSAVADGTGLAGTSSVLSVDRIVAGAAAPSVVGTGAAREIKRSASGGSSEIAGVEIASETQRDGLGGPVVLPRTIADPSTHPAAIAEVRSGIADGSNLFPAASGPGKGRVGASSLATSLGTAKAVAERVGGVDGGKSARLFGSQLVASEAVASGSVADAMHPAASAPMMLVHKVGSDSSSSPFQAIDAGNAGGYARSPLQSGPGAGRTAEHSLTVGYQDPALGYIELEARGSGTGVHASMVADSPASGAVLTGHLSSLTEWMHERQTSVESLTVMAHGSQSTDLVGSGAGSQHGSGAEGGRNSGQNQGAGEPFSGQLSGQSDRQSSAAADSYAGSVVAPDLRYTAVDGFVGSDGFGGRSQGMAGSSISLMA